MASINLQGDTSGAITISAPSVAGSNTLTLPATTQTLATQNALGVRNLIINGDMRIAQRGASATGLTNGSTGYHTVDRFQFVESGSPTSVWTMSQDTNVPTGQGFSNSLKMQCTTAQSSIGTGDSLYLFHKIEGQNLQHLKFGTSSAESITLSFWVKSNKTGTYIAELYQTDATRAVSYAYTISSADTWEKKTITYVGDTSGQIDNDNGTGLQIAFWLATGTDRSSGTLATSWATVNNPDRAVGQVNLGDSTSNYINITGVQLEVGDTATPFEHRPYDMELQRCQRYYNKTTYPTVGSKFGLGQWYNTSNFVGTSIDFPTTMRAAPTGSTTNGSAGQFKIANTSSTTASLTHLTPRATSINSAELFANSSNGATGGTTARNDVLITGVADVYVAFDAEL